MLLALAAPDAGADPCGDPEQAASLVAAAEQRTARSYASALKKKRLRPTTLPHRELAVGDRPSGPEDGAGHESGVIDVGVISVPCGTSLEDHAARYTFAIGPGKKLYRIVKRPRSSERRITLCECAPVATGRGCGLGPEKIRLGFLIPDGLTYAGTIELRYAEHVVTVGHDESRAGTVCVRPHASSPP